MSLPPCSFRPCHSPLQRSLPFLAGLFVLLMIAGLQPANAAPPHQWTAAKLFMQIPPSIFENTAAPVTEDEKEHILERGYNTNWAISHQDDDSLLITAMKGDFADVVVQVFRNANGGVVAIGARAQDSCAVELWQYDAAGSIVPVPEPDDPPVEDVLSSHVTLAKGITPGYRICLEGVQLEAKPIFWGNEGMVNVPVANRVFFRWNGSGFEKFIAPVGLPSEVQNQKTVKK